MDYMERIRQISPSHLFQAKKNPPLTEKHKSERLEFERKYMSWDKVHEWESVIFSDEKKF